MDIRHLTSEEVIDHQERKWIDVALEVDGERRTARIDHAAYYAAPAGEPRFALMVAAVCPPEPVPAKGK